MKGFLKIQDIANGTDIVKTYKFLKKSEKWGRDDIEKYRLQKLRRLLHHAYDHVPYYRELFDKYRIHPDNIKNLEEFYTIPILKKEVAKERYKDLIADNVNIDSKKIKKGKTGGTTGVPLKIYKDVYTRNFTWGAFYRWYDWMRIHPNDRVIFLWGSSKVLGKNPKSKIVYWLSEHFSRTKIINSFNLNDDSIPRLAEEIIKYKPALIRGYLSATIQIGKYLEKNNICIPGLKAISTTTETLLPHYRIFLEKAYNVPVFDQYGCGECGSIAFECIAHNGLHIAEEHTVIEILDAANKHINNQTGRIILTDLDNYAMPFIRYENGDLGILSDQKCSCGLQSDMLHSIQGRTIDTIVLKDGSEVHGVFFTDILHEMKHYYSEEFYRFQIYQKVKGKIIFRIEKNRKVVPNEFVDELQFHLARFFDKAVIEFYEKLQNEKNGKFRYIISDIPQD
jgi:phenylacetate-CoA ligase